MVDTNLTASQALYRFYSDDGHLLYVGVTNNPSGRFKQHGATKNWWPEVAGITVEWYDDRPSVLAAETRAIHVESPRYNIQRPALPPAAIIPADPDIEDAGQRIVWDCAWCGDEVDDGDGFMYVNSEELFEARHAAGTRRDAEDVATWGLGAYSEPAYWRVAHSWCGTDPDQDDSAYALEIHKLRTYPKVLWWTAHLAGKTWLSDTNWMSLIRRLATAAGGE